MISLFSRLSGLVDQIFQYRTGKPSRHRWVAIDRRNGRSLTRLQEPDSWVGDPSDCSLDTSRGGGVVDRHAG